MRRLLLVDDDPVARLVAASLVRRVDVSVVMARSGEEAKARIAEAVAEGAPFDAVLADEETRGMSGVALLEWATEVSPRTARLMLTGQPEVGAEAVARAGAGKV